MSGTPHRDQDADPRQSKAISTQHQIKLGKLTWSKGPFARKMNGLIGGSCSRHAGSPRLVNQSAQRQIDSIVDSRPDVHQLGHEHCDLLLLFGVNFERLGRLDSDRLEGVVGSHLCEDGRDDFITLVAVAAE